MKTKNPYPTNPKEVTESQLREQVRDLCKIIGWDFYFTYNSFHSPKGMTDLILCHPVQKRVLFVELKREGQSLKPDQERWRDDLSQCPGVEYYLVRPSDIEKFADILSLIRQL